MKFLRSERGDSGVGVLVVLAFVVIIGAPIVDLLSIAILKLIGY